MDEKYIQDLYNHLGGATKFGKYEDFRDMISSDQTYRKQFHDTFGEKQLGSYQDFDNLVKKKDIGKHGSVDLEGSSLQSGNSLSQSNGEALPTVSDYGNGEIVPDDIFSKAKAYNDFNSRTKEESQPIGSSFGMGTNSSVQVPDEESKKAAKKLQESNPDTDLSQVFNEVKDIPEDILRDNKDRLQEERSKNPVLYQRDVARLKWSDGLNNAIKGAVESGYLSPDNYDNLKQSINASLENSSVGTYAQQRENVQSIANKIKEFGGDKADDILKNYATEVSKVYGNSYKNGFDKSIEGTPESKYLTPEAQLGYQYLKDISPDKAAQYERLFIDQKTLKDNPDAQKGYNHLMQTLEETGIGLQQNAITEDINNLKNIADKNGGLDEQQLTQATGLEKKQEELSQKRNELDTKYPDRIPDKVNDAVNEVMGKDINWGEYAAVKTGQALKNTGEGIWESVSTPFMSDASNKLRELSLMGETITDENNLKQPDKNKALLNDKMIIQPELQTQVDAIKNNKILTDDQKRKQLYSLFYNNTDKFGRVPIQGGQFNVNPSSILYGLTDLGTSLLPFVGLEYLTGGGATASAGRKFLSTFTSAAATSFHDEYANAIMEGKPQSEAYKSAMASTAITSFAMAGASTPTELRAMAKGNSSAEKIIQGMSDKAIQDVLDKGTPKGLSKLKQAFVDRAKATPDMVLGGLKTGAKFEAYMGAANEINGKEQNFKQSLLNIANFGIMGAGLGHVGYKSPTELQKGSIVEFGKNPDAFRSELDDMKKNGMSQSEYDHRKMIIDKSEEAYKTLPKANAKGQPLTEKEKGEYMYNTVIKNEGKKAASTLPPKQAEKAEMTAMVADHANDIILDTPTDKQLQDRKDKLEKALIPEKDADGKNIEIPEKELLNTKAELQAVNDAIENKPKVTEDNQQASNTSNEGKGGVVDEGVGNINGKPNEDAANIEWHHGTTKDFADLSSDNLHNDLGIFLTSDKELANEYTKLTPFSKEESVGRLVSTKVNPKKTYDIRFGRINEADVNSVFDALIERAKKLDEEKDGITPMHVKFQKAKEGLLSAKNVSEWKVAEAKMYDAAMELAKREGGYKFASVAPLKEELQKLGFDSVRKVDDGADTLVVLDKNILQPKEQSLSTKPEIKNEEDQATKISKPTTEGSNTAPPNGKSIPKAETGEKVGKFEEKARKLADKIKASETPSWLKIDDPNVKKKGIGEDDIKEALANATIKMGKLLDKGVEFGEAVKEAVKDLVDLMGEGMRDKIENGFRDDYNKGLGEFAKTGVKKEVTNETRAANGMPKVTFPKMISDVEALNAAKERVDSGKVNPQEMVDRILKDKTNYKNEDEVMDMQYYAHQLQKRNTELNEQLADAETPEAKLDIVNQKMQLSDLIDAQTEAAETAGNQWGKTGNRMKPVINDAGQIFRENKILIKEAYGGEVPKEVQAKLDALTKERDDALAAKAKVEEQLRQKMAENGFEAVKKQAKKTANRNETKEALKKEEEQLLKDLKQAFKKDLGNLNSGIPIPKETLDTLGKLAINYFKQGVNGLEALVDRLHDNLKDTGLTRKQIKDAIANYEPLTIEQETARLNKKADLLMNRVTPPTLDKKGRPTEPVDLSAPPKEQKFFRNNTEWVKANQRVANAEHKMKILKRQAFESKKNLYQKGLMWLGRITRLSVLSGKTVLAKLASAAVIGGAIKRVPEQAITAIYSTAFKGIAKKAPIEGFWNAKAEAKFYKDFFNPKKFAQNSWEILKTGSTDLGKRLGGAEYEHVPVLYLPTDLHQIIKDPLKRAAFEASFHNGLVWAEKNGLDINDPLVINSIENAAYKRGQYEIFQESNKLSRWFISQKAALEKGGNAGATAKFVVDFMIPVSTVPANIVRRVATTSPVGMVRGSVKVIDAYRKGLEKLTNEEAESIMKQLKQGTLGTALWLAGWFGYQSFGGLYSQFNPNKRREEDDKKSDVMIVNGEEIPKPVQHALPLEVIQMAATARRIYENYKDNKNASDIDALTNAGLGSIGALAEQIPVVETPMHMVLATQDPVEADKLKEDLGRRIKPQILREFGSYDSDFKNSKEGKFLEDHGLKIVDIHKEGIHPVDAQGNKIKVSDEKFNQLVTVRERKIQDEIKSLRTNGAVIWEEGKKIDAKDLTDDQLRSWLMKTSTKAKNEAIDEVFGKQPAPETKPSVETYQ